MASSSALAVCSAGIHHGATAIGISPRPALPLLSPWLHHVTDPTGSSPSVVDPVRRSPPVVDPVGRSASAVDPARS